MIDVLIALHDPISSIGLGVVVDGTEDLRCVGVMTNREVLRGVVHELRPDVLVLDVRHRRSDARLVPDLVEDSPETRILVAVDHGPEECALRHMLAIGGRAGLSREALDRLDDCCLTSLRQQATGCIDVSAEPETALKAIRAVAAGKLAAAPWLSAVAETVQTLSGVSPEETHPITARELEIVALLAEGLSNKQIAARLGIKEQTVKNHVGRAVGKLGAETRLEVGLMASKHHLRLTPD